MTPPGPARLHVLLAREAPIGLVIRRGPAKHVCALVWNRVSDTFTLGQWMKGRIKNAHCDISPDGKYWIYFAAADKWGQTSAETWTAVARVPFLKALTFLPNGIHSNGGGLFTGPRRYRVDGPRFHTFERESPELVYDDAAFRADGYGNILPHPYHHRLLRDGWTLEGERTTFGDAAQALFERPLGSDWVLQKTLSYHLHPPIGKERDSEENALVQKRSLEINKHPGWECADVDGERLVWAEGGKLFAGRMSEAGLEYERMLHDFNDMQFEAIAAPY